MGYNVEEYAQIIGKSAYTVRKMIRDGKLDAYIPPGTHSYVIRGPKEQAPTMASPMPEDANMITLVTMLEKIQATDKDAYKKVIKEIYMTYCKTVM